MHLHHIVVGIVLVLGSGLLFIGSTPEEGFFQLMLAAAFGSGAALVLDEFALVFRLQDVYWSDEGRSSIDAIVIAVVLGALVLLHATPFGAGDSGDVGRWTLAGYIALNLVAVTVTLAKGKLYTATVRHLLTRLCLHRCDPAREAALAVGAALLPRGEPSTQSARELRAAPAIDGGPIGDGSSKT